MRHYVHGGHERSTSDGLAFTFRLSRTDGQHESTVTIPGPFSVRAVPVSDVVHRDGETIVTWGNIQDADKEILVSLLERRADGHRDVVSRDRAVAQLARFVRAPAACAALGEARARAVAC